MKPRTKLTFLGTGTSMGVPVICCDCVVCQSTDSRDKRLRCSVYIEVEDKKILIDTTPDFREQMLRANIRQIDAVLYTHEHRDHVAGLDDMRAFYYLGKQAINIFADHRVQAALKLAFPYFFAEKKYPGVPDVNVQLIENEPFEVQGIAVQPIEVMHYKLPVLGFRIGDLTYITDANFIAEEEKEKIRGSKILILNALRLEKHISHFTLQEAIDLVEELEIERAYFTHISHQLGTHAEVEAMLPDHISLAYDGLTVEI